VANAYPNLPTSTYPVRLPTLNSDSNAWGAILNNFLSSSHTAAGFLSTISVQSTNYSMQLYPGETVLASGSITITLPTAVNNSNFYTVKKTDATGTTVTVSTVPSQTIDGGSSAVISVQYVSVTVVSNGSNWFVI